MLIRDCRGDCLSPIRVVIQDGYTSTLTRKATCDACSYIVSTNDDDRFAIEYSRHELHSLKHGRNGMELRQSKQIRAAVNEQ